MGGRTLLLSHSGIDAQYVFQLGDFAGGESVFLPALTLWLGSLPGALATWLLWRRISAWAIPAFAVAVIPSLGLVLYATEGILPIQAGCYFHCPPGPGEVLPTSFAIAGVLAMLSLPVWIHLGILHLLDGSHNGCCRDQSLTETERHVELVGGHHTWVERLQELHMTHDMATLIPSPEWTPAAYRRGLHRAHLVTGQLRDQAMASRGPSRSRIWAWTPR